MAHDRAHDSERLLRARALAVKGRFGAEPNPLVGCVLDRNGRIVGEGWHAMYGGPHAEAMALARAGDDARGATAYVTLEPCSRHGKTPPCCDALIDAQVARVVYEREDPHEDGRGRAALAAAGIEVVGPRVEGGEADALLEMFAACATRARPWVILKWAMTLDGRIGSAPGEGGRITGARAAAFTHELRAHVDAVAVGVDTILVDDPRLTCRLAEGGGQGRPQPARVVFDSTLRLPPTARLFEDVDDAPVVVMTASSDEGARRLLESAGAQVVQVPGADGRANLATALGWLRDAGRERMLVEGGARVHGAFLRSGLADQVSALVAPRILGREDAPVAVQGSGILHLDDALPLREAQWRLLGDDLLVQGYVAASPGALSE